MFTISSLDDIFNHTVPQHFDDFRVRQQSLLLEDLGQLCPEYIDGTRQVLWFCQGCQSVWRQISGTDAELQLSPSKQTMFGHRFHASFRDDGTLVSLPQHLCPACLRGMLTLGAYPDRLGLKILWNPDTTITPPPAQPRNTIATMESLPHLLVALLEWHPGDAMYSVGQMSELALSWLVDEPSDLDSAPLIARWLDSTVLIPRQQECQALSETALVPVHRLIHEAGKRWHGYAWDVPPILSRSLTRNRLLLVIAALTPQEDPSSPHHLLTFLSPLLDLIFKATGWSRR